MQLVIDGKVHESKFNFYSLDYANKLVEKEEAKDIVTVYNELLVFNKFDALITSLQYIFTPKNNGGLTRDSIIKGLEQLEDNDTNIDELIENVLSEMESSGFFLRTLKKSNRMMEKSIEGMKKMKLDPVEKAEMNEIQLQLDRAKERGLI